MKIFLFVFLLFSINANSAVKKFNNIVYQTDFGPCPINLVSDLSLTLVKEFEKNLSLKDVKNKIITEKLEEKYFLSSYKVNFNPAKKMIKFKFECPKALMKVQIYKGIQGGESYMAILGHDGKLYGQSYEDILRKENLLTYNLPLLAFPVEDLNTEYQDKIASMVKRLNLDLMKNLSEVIINQNHELSMTFSFNHKTTSIFYGNSLWDDKAYKMNRILNYMESKGQYPKSINISNLKKVVVKF